MPRPRDLLAFTAAAVALVASLGTYGLVEPSDARYAEIAREMWASRDFLFPRLLGIYHFHKPPLIYWLADLGFAGLGTGEWGARACLGGLGLALCVLLWRFGRRHLGPRAAPWAVAFLATTPAVIGAGRMLTTDLLLCVCLAAALTGWYDAWSGVRGRSALVQLYLAAGLAFLAKGPVAWLLILAVLVPFRLLAGPPARRAGGWGLAWGLPLVCAVALPWYLYVVWKTPGLLTYFLGGQIASRFREGGMGHAHSWLYYLWLYPLLGLPWILLAPRGWSLLRRGAPAPLARFLLLWAVVPPLFFTLPATKLPLYVLPAYPAVALLAAAVLGNASDRAAGVLRSTGFLFLLLGTALVLVGIGVVPLRGGDVTALSRADLRALFLPLAAVTILAGGAAVGWARERPAAAAVALVAALAALPAWAFSRGDALPLRTAAPVGRVAARALGPGDLLVEYRDLSAGLPFYAGTIPVLASIDRETQFESAATRSRVIDEEAFRELWTGPRRILVVTRVKRRGDLEGGVELARGGGYVLVANR